MKNLNTIDEPYPHACKAGHAHERKEHNTGSLAGQTENTSNEHTVDVRLAQC